MTKLAGLSFLNGDKWCLMGDFNIERFVEEKINSDRNTRSMRMFNELIGELSLTNISLYNAQFTWLNFRTTPTCCILDRFLFIGDWENLFNFIRQEVVV